VRTTCRSGHTATEPDPSRASTGRDVAELEGSSRPLEERGLAPDALHERHGRVGARNRQREAREPAARAEVGDPTCASDDVELECDERVRDVHVHAIDRVADGRDRRRLRGHELEQSGELRQGAVRQRVSGVERLEPGLHRGSRHDADRKT